MNAGSWRASEEAEAEADGEDGDVGDVGEESGTVDEEEGEDFSERIPNRPVFFRLGVLLICSPSSDEEWLGLVGEDTMWEPFDLDFPRFAREDKEI